MREETIKIYQFEELSLEAQGKAIQWYRESMSWGFESEEIGEDFKSRLKELGYPESVEWSLSYCQGDGVAFYGVIDGEDMDKIAFRLLDDNEFALYRKIVNADFPIYGKIGRTSAGHHYSHYNTMYVKLNHDDVEYIVQEVFGIEDEDNDEYADALQSIENLVETLESAIQADVKDTSKELERIGYKAIEYYQSDETIKENIIANKYEFTADGKRY